MVRWLYCIGGCITVAAVLQRWLYYRDGCITEVDVLQRCIYYGGGCITGAAVLNRWPYYTSSCITEVAVEQGSHAEVSVLKEHATLSIKMLKPPSSVYCITCHIFYSYLILRSFSKCLRRITDPLWSLTFWAFYLKRPLPPQAVKTNSTHWSAKSAQAETGWRYFTLWPNQRNDHLQLPNFSWHILYTYTYIRLQCKITCITETSTIHKTNSHKTWRQHSSYTRSCLITVISVLGWSVDY